MKLISKSKIKQNNQCEKLLWLEINRPELKLNTDSSLKSFSIGKKIEKIAKNNFSGKEVTSIKNIDKLTETNLLLKNNETIFEAAFSSDNLFVQVDILTKIDNELYDIIEIKSGTKITPDYLDDITIQYFVIKNSNTVKINKYYIWHINKESSNEKDLFIKVDVTDTINQRIDDFKNWTNQAKKTFFEKKEISKEIGTHCNNPYECPFKQYCWKNELNNPLSVLNLPFFSKKWKAYNSGIKRVNDPSFQKNYQEFIDKNPHIYKSLIENQLVRDEPNILKDISKLDFPIFFLDFESLMTPTPIFKGQKPYEQKVFQYSIHRLDKNLEIKHLDFLKNDLELNNKVSDSLLIDLEKKGSIVVFNKTFEISRIKDFIKIDQNNSDNFQEIINRIFDFAELMEKTSYHPNFLGSFSLKTVSKVLFENKMDGYSKLNIKNGSEVSDIYSLFLETNDLNLKQKLEKDLRDYNKLDTLNLVVLYFWFIDLKNIDKNIKLITKTT